MTITQDSDSEASVKSAQSNPVPEITFLFPCLNEAETIAACIKEVSREFAQLGLRGEILVADNGSTDGSQDLAREAGARVIDVVEHYPDVVVRGYGTGLLAGIEASRSEYVVLADSDGSYDVSSLGMFVEKLREGNDLVMGNRFRGGIEDGAMPGLHRWIGNPMMSFLGRIFFAVPIGDVNCGIRGCRREAILGLGLRSMGMEFAIEMVAKASLNNLRIAEVPTVLRRDGRTREPHLRTFHDGWRQLRFMLLYSPHWLFLYPGFALFGFGVVLMILLANQPIVIAGAQFDVHSMLVALAAIVLGSQTVLSFLLAYQYATDQGVLPSSPRFDAFLKFKSLERAVVVGGLIFLSGLTGLVISALIWAGTNFSELDTSRMMRLVIPSVAAMIVGVQLATAGFVSSVLELKGQSGRRT